MRDEFGITLDRLIDIVKGVGSVPNILSTAPDGVNVREFVIAGAAGDSHRANIPALPRIVSPCLGTKAEK
jgi:hypothetical protein